MRLPKTYTESTHFPINVVAMAHFLNQHDYENGRIKLYKRGDVKSDYWYARIKIPNADRYKHKCLKTSDRESARLSAFRLYFEIDIKVENGIPVISRNFNQVAKESLADKKARVSAGNISERSYLVSDSHFRTHLADYFGTKPITSFTGEDWLNYPDWRRLRKNQANGKTPADATIQGEIANLKAILNFAARKNYILQSAVPTDKIEFDAQGRDDFSEKEIQTLQNFLRLWQSKSKTKKQRWERDAVGLYINMMIATGMRIGEARRLKVSDFKLVKYKDGGMLCHVSVLGKKKKGKRTRRTIVATMKVWHGYQELMEMRPKTAGDEMFITYDGTPSRTMYNQTVRKLLKTLQLELGRDSKSWTPYSFRHTYITFLLQNGEERQQTFGTGSTESDDDRISRYFSH